MIGHMLIALLAAGSISTPAAHASPSSVGGDEAADLYREMRLEGVLDQAVFAAGYGSAQSHGIRARMLAIADMSQPSTAKRLYVFDLDTKRLVLRTFVAHGSNSGELMAERFSNREGSHQSSLGLYRVGPRIVSPKWGPALLLDGLDRGVNDAVRSREVIVHGATYVSADFIAQFGRLGRTWGCPAVPLEDMPRVIALFADGGLLYVHGVPARRGS
jgi:hypothetical protein